MSACRRLPGLAALAFVLLTGACASKQAINPAAPPAFSADKQTILLMPIDVQLYELSAAGLEEPRMDWTDAAHAHVMTALEAESTERRLDLVLFDYEDAPEANRADVYQIVKLHEAVGRAMLLHRYVPALRLPTKASEFDWEMGDEITVLDGTGGADYALFLFFKDSYSSADRVLMNIATAILFGYAQGGTQVGYATMVDLRTGKIVWFGSLQSNSGDLRNAEDAAKAVDSLMSGLPGA